MVYGGGGITPDIEIEQSRLTNFEVEIRRKNLIFDYSVDYLQNNNDVNLNFFADENLVSEFLGYAKNKEIEYEQADLDSAYTWIQNQLTSNIIGRKFGEEERYRISIKEDTQLQEAIEIFNDYPTLEMMFDFSNKLKNEKP